MLTPFGTEADGTTPFESARFHISFDLGGVRFTGERATMDEARAAVEAMDSPEGYSSHSATISEWRERAVDGKPYLSPVERYWFGKLVDYKPRRERLSPLLDSDGPDYDPEAFLGLVDA